MGKNGFQIHTSSEIEKMRIAGRFAWELLELVEKEIRPGITTEYIDQLVDKATRERGARSAPYGYKGFPKHCCTSINEVICHGIPSEHRELKEGDIINVDVTPVIEGFHGDTSRTFYVGKVSAKARKLVEVTFESMWRGIKAVRPGATTGDIGHAIQSFVEPQGFSVVRDFVGHGVGRVFHSEPTVFHFGRPGAGTRLMPGMTFTIEPMINAGDYRAVVLPDQWTAVTWDGQLSAQFEHTVVVTDNGVEVLTVPAEYEYPF